jgi:hypothetical protein
MLPVWRHLRGRGNRTSQNYSQTPRKYFPPKDLWYSVTMILNSVGPNETTRHSGESFDEGPIPKSTGSADSSSPIRCPGAIHVTTDLKQSDERYWPNQPKRYQDGHGQW